MHNGFLHLLQLGSLASPAAASYSIANPVPSQQRSAVQPGTRSVASPVTIAQADWSFVSVIPLARRCCHSLSVIVFAFKWGVQAFSAGHGCPRRCYTTRVEQD